MSEQSPAQNIQQEIDTTTMIIFWKMRNWKTLNAICIWLEYYPRIYSNVNIYQENKKGEKNSIVKYLKDYQSIRNIRFSYTPWILIIDEAGLNANSKDWQNKDNRILQEVLFLIWKRNLSLIWIAQRYESVDINARALVDLVLEMKKIKRGKKHPIFIVTKKKQVWSQLKFITSYKLDSISIMNHYKISYDQLEESKLESTPKEGYKKLKDNLTGNK